MPVSLAPDALPIDNVASCFIVRSRKPMICDRHPARGADPARLPSPYFLCGPTASGKSALALEIARDLDGEVVNADAFQLYRGIEVLSAAPTVVEQESIPHHLFGVLELSARCDAGRYLRMARPVIEDVQSRGKTPVVVGGSGLYLKFLSHGPSPLPVGDPALRAALDARPLEDLVVQLQSLDPVEAARTALQNRRYVSRALEICLLTGGKASALRDAWASASAAREADLRGVVIVRERSDLHRRIAQRTRAMLDGGAIEEVAAALDRPTTAAQAIGFAEIRAHLSGEITRATCEERINAATRQYAKRQETWFRRESWLASVRR